MRHSARLRTLLAAGWLSASIAGTAWADVGREAAYSVSAFPAVSFPKGAGQGTGESAGSLRYGRWASVVALGTAQPLEEALSVGATQMLRTVRRWIRGFGRTVSWSLQQWADWTVGSLGIIVLALFAPLVDRQLFGAWRRNGFGAFRVSAILALAVYVRLLFDRRAPAIGKLLLLFAVLFGVAPNDLLPDRLSVIGFVDDVVAVSLASRIFTRLCPDRLVEEHAVKAASAWERAVRARIPNGAVPGASQL
jgi:uncharacterized membrane protein YkvA (DUF1232 family)